MKSWELHMKLSDESPFKDLKWVSRLQAFRHELNTVYATFTGYRDDDSQSYIYRSTDAGESWTSISGNLPP